MNVGEKWGTVAVEDWCGGQIITKRRRVPGGWLYMAAGPCGIALTFVPEVDQLRRHHQEDRGRDYDD